METVKFDPGMGEFAENFNEYINDFITMNNISRELIVNLIQKIEIYKDKRINIVLTFSKDYVL